MTTICPKCQQIRPATATVPDWQCPCCGVAYAKARDGGEATAMRATQSTGWRPSRTEPDRTWLKLLLGVLVLGAGYLAWNKVGAHLQRLGGGGGYSAQSIAQLASSVKPGDVVIYTTNTCPYCTRARGWLSQNGFAYTECNIETHSSCDTAMRSYGAQGVPFLVVKGRQMHEGFDSEQFLQVLTP